MGEIMGKRDFLTVLLCGFLICCVFEKPEKDLLGKWLGRNEILVFEKDHIGKQYNKEEKLIAEFKWVLKDDILVIDDEELKYEYSKHDVFMKVDGKIYRKANLW